MAIEKIDKIRQVGKKVEPHAIQKEPNKDYFESLMNQRKVEADRTVQQTAEVPNRTENTVFDLSQKTERTTLSSPRELAARTDDVVAQIETLKHKLETPDLEIKNSVQTVLRQKLNRIDDTLKVALDRAGLDYQPPERTTSLAKPMERFIGLLTNSQRQLETIGEDVRAIALSNRELSPANMLLLQVKVSYIQQEIELFTSMLNKALESTKTVMNVQV